AEAARHQDAVHVLQPGRTGLDVLRLQPLQVDRVRWRRPPCLSASPTDLYASLWSTYLPTTAMVTSSTGLTVASTAASHSCRSAGRCGCRRRRSATSASRPWACSSIGSLYSTS